MHNLKTTTKSIIIGCFDELPIDYKVCWYKCTQWAPHCNKDWSEYSDCVEAPIGKIKDHCRKTCNNCAGKYCVIP